MMLQTKGNFKLAMVDYKKMQPMQQRKVLNVLNEQAFERLGVENGVNLVEILLI